MKLLVTGHSGFVAGSILAQAPQHWHVHGLGRSAPAHSTGRTQYHQADMLNVQQLTAVFNQAQPDAVIHTAAMANIDYCEGHQQEAEAVNVGGTQLIAQLCSQAGAKLVLCSTDTVFNGVQGNYTEADAPHGVNWYAQTKIQAEQAVLAAHAGNVVARLALVMGLPVMNKGNSFLADMMEKLKKGERLKFPENEIRTPIDVLTLGAALLELAASPFAGIIHLAGNTVINRYQMANIIAERAGFSANSIEAINSNQLPGRAPRPNNASLNNTLARSVLKTPMLSLEEGLSKTLTV